MRVPFFLLAAGCALSLALIVAPFVIADTPTPASDDLEGLPAPNQIDVLFSVNNVGFIDVCGCKKKKVRQGSVTRRASYLNQLRARGHKLLVIDGGNTLFGVDDPKAEEFQRKQLIDKAKVIIESYNRMDYKVMNLGHLDLTMGLDTLLELRDMANFPFICANFAYEETGELVFPPTHEIEIHGLKIGFLGLIHDDMQPAFYKKRAPQCTVLDGIEQAKKFVPGLRERNDLVFALSYNHVDHHRRLISEVGGIDIVIDPHLDRFGGLVRGKLDEEKFHMVIDDVLLARTAPEGHSLGTMAMKMLEIHSPLVNRATGEVPEGRSSYVYKREKIEPHMGSDPEIDMLVENFKKGTFTRDIPDLPPLPHKDKYLTSSTCMACHPDQYTWWQNTGHAHAFATLEETGDQWRQDCIGCHTVGYGQAFIAPKDAEPYKNVQCESCHGLNPEHPADPEANPWPKIKQKDCLVCHNKSQTRVEFQYSKSKRQIACPKMERK